MEQQCQDEGQPEEYDTGSHVEEENDGQTEYLAAQYQNTVNSGFQHRMGLFDCIGQPDRHGRE